MARDLNLKVLLGFTDKVTKPLRNLTGSSAKLSRQFRDTREHLKKLEAQQKDVSSFRALGKQVRDNARLLDEKQTRVRQLAQELERTERPTKKLNAEFRRAQREAAALKDKHQAQQRTLQGLRTRLNNAGISTRNLGSHERRLRGDITSANQALKRQEEALRRVGQQQKRLRDLNAKHGREMTRVGMLGAASYGTMAAGQRVGTGLFSMLTPGIDFGAQMSELQAIARLRRQDPRFQMLKNQARQLGATTQFTATDVGAGQTFLARAGFSPRAIASSMRDVLDMAIANRTELAQTADIASNIAGAFKIDPEVEGNFRRVADVLSGTAARANVNLEMLGDTMKYLGGAEDLKLSLEQAAAMAGLLGNIGLQGTQAGTTLRAMMNRLTAPARLGRKAMEKINLQVKDANDNLRAMPDILRDISTATARMGNAQRKKILQHIFGAEAGSGMAELVSQMATGGLDTLLEQLQNLQGENGRMAKTIADNASGDLKGLRSAWEDVGITLTETNNGPLRELINTTTGVVRNIGAWIRENPKLAATLFKAAAGFAIVATAMGAIGVGLAGIAAPLLIGKFLIARLAISAASLAPVFTALGSTVLPAVIGGIKALGAAILATPVGWILAGVAAVAGAALLICKYWEPIKAFFAGLWMGIQDSMGPAIERFRAALAVLWKISPIRPLWEALAPALQSVWNWLKKLFTPVQSTAAGLEKATSAGRAFGQFLGDLVMFLPNLVSQFTNLGGRIVDGLVNGIKAKFRAVKGAITGLGDSTIGWFKDKLGIRSPSRVFAALGDHTMAGLAKGLKRSQRGPLAAIADTGKKLAAGGALAASIGVSPGALAVDNRPPLAQHRAPVVVQGDTITVNITVPQGGDANAIARAVNQALDERSRHKQVRARTALYDQQ